MIEPDPRSDAELIFAAADDPDAFRFLYDRYAERLHGFFARRSGSSQVAVDLTAEMFAQAWLSRRRFRDLADGSAGPWLFTIARRLLIASVRRGRVETRMLERLRVDWTATAGELTPDERWLEGMDAEIEAALGSLPRDQRRALWLRVVDELPYSAVAFELGCSPTAARIRVSRGVARLRTLLEGGQG